MSLEIINQLSDYIDKISIKSHVGRVDTIANGVIRICGLSHIAALGDRIEFIKTSVLAEIIRLDRDAVYVLADGPLEGVCYDDKVMFIPQKGIAPSQTMIGRVIDPDGKPLDGRALLPGSKVVNLQASPPLPHHRRDLGERIETGMATFNTILPIVQGQRIGLFAGSGVGKSTLLAKFAQGVEADIIVIALVGERGREVRHFVESVLGSDGMARSVVVAATSDQAPQTRRRCAWSAMAIAEYFRDQGLHVMLLLDSVTRFCEAHREIAVARGEDAALRGYPASTASAIASLCERAGPGGDGQGDITAVFSVLVAGSDMDEPVADMLRGVLDGHVVLEREIAERGRFPAVNVLKSVSRSLPEAAAEMENNLIVQAREFLGVYAKAELMIQAGLYSRGSDAKIDKAIACEPEIENFLTLQDDRGTQAHFAALRHALSFGGAQT